MAREIPAAPKIYTTTYDSFKGVDFTNDQTNIWRRRSPTGTNMLPDESGRPFKRHGWSILLTNAELSEQLGVESCNIFKCSYFELAGVDHIVIFTDEGVLFYNGEFTAVNKEYPCYTGYDRSFFFEGNGISAFYIYGDFRVWRYGSDFTLAEVTDEIPVPKLLISTSADGTGTFYEGYNLLGTKASIEYSDCTLLTYWCSDGIGITMDEEAFKAERSANDFDIYKWAWDGGQFAKDPANPLTLAQAHISYNGTPKLGDEIVLLYVYGVMLPNDVSQSQIGDVKVNTSKSLQFDLPLTVRNSNYSTQSMTDKDCKLWSDDTANRGNKRAWIQFEHAWAEVVAGEDFIRVEFPSVNINVTEYPIAGHETDCESIGTASLVGA